jgi:hypothetical protein
MKTTNKSLPRNPDILLNKNQIFPSNWLHGKEKYVQNFTNKRLA